MGWAGGWARGGQRRAAGWGLTNLPDDEMGAARIDFEAFDKRAAEQRRHLHTARRVAARHLWRSRGNS